MITLLRIATFVLVFWLVLKAIKWLFVSWLNKKIRETQTGGGQVTDMVKCETCGAYTESGVAMMEEREGRQVFYCSSDCRNKAR